MKQCGSDPVQACSLAHAAHPHERALREPRRAAAAAVRRSAALALALTLVVAVRHPEEAPAKTLAEIRRFLRSHPM